MKFELDFKRVSATLDAIDGVVLNYTVVGSAMYRDDAKDLDVLVLFDGLKFTNSDFAETFFPRATFCGDYDTEEGKWMAVRDEDVNLILTHDVDFYDKFVTASNVCAALKVPAKRDRMIVFRIVRDGMGIDEATADVDAFQASQEMKFLAAHE